METKYIATLTEADLRYKDRLQDALDYYRHIRETWTAQAIADLRDTLGVNLRTNLGKAQLAIAAARTQSAPPTERKAEKPLEGVVTMLCKVLAFLPPVPPTNGLEEAPGWRLFGSPIYIHELDAGYSALLKTYHPDVNPDPDARLKMSIINRIYKKLRAKWTLKYSPLLPQNLVTKELVEMAMGVNLELDPDETWESAKHNYPRLLKMRVH